MHITRSAVDPGLELSSLDPLAVVGSNDYGQNVIGEGDICKMSRSIPYSQQQENNKSKGYHQHQQYQQYQHHHQQHTGTFQADRQYNHSHQYHHLNGYYGNQSYHYRVPPYSERQHRHFASTTTSATSSWAPDGGKRKSEEPPYVTPPNTRQKVDSEDSSGADEQTTTSTVPSARNLPSSYPAASHRSYHQKESRSIGYPRYDSARAQFSYGRTNQNSWQRSSLQGHEYQNENIPPTRTSSTTASSPEQRGEDLTCKGCLVGKDSIHLKFFHSILTESLYSGLSKSRDIMAQQIPGCAFIHDGLCFGFEKNKGDKWLVVRGTGCLGMAAVENKCQICHGQQSHVDGRMQELMATHAEPPEQVCQTASIDRIKMVPTLAEMKMRQMKCEIEDYKENSITVVNV
ncbi:unnamed protein product [Cylindrotheca closterium]|uniref:Uncharacterized protein n=1 Tax=Cylindrotheca closterium TaxID=2856 RepID=A0AAD2JN67_9STRA|nr:unnamed protein product [Cylindrotheca closterium]